MRFVFFLFAFSIFIYAQSDQELLNRAQNYSKSSSKTDQVRAYDDYKNLYLRAVAEKNYSNRLSALEGIVKSGNQLKIDVEKYEKELKKEREKQVTQKKASSTTSKTQNIKAPNESKKENKKINIASSHSLDSIHWKGGTLLFNFDKELTPKQISHFTLHEPKKNRYRYIFDIRSSKLKDTHNLHKNGIDKIKIAQFDQDKVRLVIENSSKLEISTKKSGKTLSINTNIQESIQKHHASASTPHAKHTQTKYKPISKHKVIVIDPGHGGKDPGAVGYKNYREKVVVLDISKKLKVILESRGYRVHMTRERDRFLTLRERTAFANKRQADLFVSIHANAVEKVNANKTHGIESYFLDKSRSNRAKNVAAKENSADLSGLNFYAKESFLNTLSSHNIIASNKLAIDLQGGMLRSLRSSYKEIKDGGVRPAPFWVLVGAQMPAVLVEVGFITHPMEAQRLVDKNYQEKLAIGLANGIDSYFRNN